MDAVTAGLFVAASFASGLYANKNQAKIEAANTNMQISQARLQTAEAAYERTKQFRENVSANLALSGLGVGGLSGFRNINAKNTTDYFADLAALGSQDMFTQALGYSKTAATKSKQFSSDINAGLDAFSLASDLGLFTGKKKKGK
jgi:hypothetical protein